MCSGNTKWCKNRQGHDLTEIALTAVQKIEPKLCFENEDELMHWSHAGIMSITTAIGVLLFVPEGDHDQIDGGNGITRSKHARWCAMTLLPVSLGFCLCALCIFVRRVDRIKMRSHE